ncbi:hypothetical protein [Roseovarius aestuariivivens]|uniref:hypothetical protein n=1 Tax=Roseovarius aestuariivivens TaxID=1888910 RepID=UPI00107FEB76|nr:hypothetical protein [Roseovarius aestuariivivens]
MTQIDPARPPSAPLLWRGAGAAAVAAAVVMALVYGWIEYELTGRLADGWLIGLVTLNTVIVYRFGLHIVSKLYDLARVLPPKGAEARPPDGGELTEDILGHPLMPLFGLGYGVLFWFGMTYLAPWTCTGETPPEPCDAALGPWLSWFIGTANIMIGMGLFAVLRFWLALRATIPAFPVRILNLSRAPILELVRVNAEVVMTTAAVTCVAILGLVLADYNMNSIGLGFAIFAFAVVLLTYALPMVPLSNRLARAKAEELDQIERLIDARVRRDTHQAPRRIDPGDPDCLRTDKDLPDLETLTRARDMILSVRTLPPGGQVSVSAAGIVTFLSFLPSLIDYAMRNLF